MSEAAPTPRTKELQLVAARGEAGPASTQIQANAQTSVASLNDAQTNNTQPSSAPQAPVPQAGAQLTSVQPQSAPAQGAPSTAVPAPRGKRGVLLPLIVLAALGFGAYQGYNYFVEGRFLVTTDDAYIKADTAVIAAKIAGYVKQVHVLNDASVKAGDLLVTLDDGDYQLALAAAQDKRRTQDATLARLDRQAEAQASNVTQVKAQLTAAEADAQRASVTFARLNPLVASGAVTKATLDTATADRDRSAAAVVGAQAAVTAAEGSLSVIRAQKAEAEAARRELDTAVDKAQRDLSFVEIRAPFDGVIGNRAAQVGQYVQPGTRLLAVVPVSHAYIEANLKETQLAKVVPGQSVEVEIDALPGRKIEGKVEGLSPASGAEFSLLPPENATGNFTKIVQRIPVRISLPPEVMKEGNMRPGLSVSVAIQTRDPKSPKPSLLKALGLQGLFGRPDVQ